jgi:3-oxosteroid 1-dehydrogenase
LPHQEFDVVVVGAGGGGLTCALRSHDRGMRVLVVEASRMLGGATGYSGGQVWAGANHLMREQGLEDSLDDTLAYVLGIAERAEDIDEDVARQWVNAAPAAVEYLARDCQVGWQIIPNYPDYYFPQVAGARETGRYLTSEPVKGAEIGDIRSRVATTPHYPMGISYGEMFDLDARAKRDLLKKRAEDDVLSFGPGIAAYLARAIAERDITVLFEHRATELVVTGGAVTGVVCETPNGPVTFSGPVVLATSTYDWDAELVEKYDSLTPGTTGSVAPPTLRGDGLRLATAVGAGVQVVPAHTIPHTPGYRTAERDELDQGYRGFAEMSSPHCMIVNGAGKRFSDDSFHRSVVRESIGPDGIDKSPNFPLYIVWDEQHHQKYGIRPGGPGAPYPPEVDIKAADTIEGLAAELGIDATGLAETVERFNGFARAGVDLDFHRGENRSVQMYRGDPTHGPNPTLGALEVPPYFGLKLLMLTTAIAPAGIRTTLSGQVVTDAGRTIPGLYAIGSAAAANSSGTGYNSGFSLSRAVTFGYLAAEHISDGG